jgi:AcrR family transcriptional regulator
MSEAAQIADFQKKFKYHHGNLREALLSAALSLLEHEGVEGLSLRTLAKATGVTQAAPYSHFRDKDELLAAVAETGFQRLAFKMAEEATGAPSVQARIEKLVTAYIGFALQNKALFQIMFGRELSDIKQFPTLAMTAGKSYSLISTALAQRTSTDIDTRFLTVSVWSLCHGLTTLIIDDKIKISQFGAETVEDFVKKSVAVFAGHLV